jgi:hypothetical protein
VVGQIFATQPKEVKINLSNELYYLVLNKLETTETKNAIYNCDFLNFITFIKDGHCNYSCQASKKIYLRRCVPSV